jgi:hypothetical protein
VLIRAGTHLIQRNRWGTGTSNWSFTFNSQAHLPLPVDVLRSWMQRAPGGDDEFLGADALLRGGT